MLEKRKYIYIIISLLILAAISLSDIGIPFQAKIVLAITVFAGIMWILEALPLHVTGLIVAFLLATIGGFAAKNVFNPFFDPIIALLLGGFVLAVAMQKHKLDEYIALRFLNKVGCKPRNVLFGMMVITAFLSFWITNTASTLIMLPIAVSILRSNKLMPLKSNYGKGLILGVAFAATIGGIGTIIGSTPNAIAVKFLADEGITITFLDWMFFGMPLVLIMLPIIWILISFFFKPEIKKIKIAKFSKKITDKQKITLGVFAVTVFLWLTTSWHSMAGSVVALIPIILLYALNQLKVKDFSKVNWAALILFGSGLSLGSAIHASGLDVIISSSVGDLVIGQHIIIVLFTIAVVGIILTAVASNTAAAAIFVPIIMPFATAMGIDLRLLTILAAIAVSLDFLVPIGTPPSTIAYSSGFVRIKDMFKIGIVISTLATIVLVMLFFVW